MMHVFDQELTWAFCWECYRLTLSTALAVAVLEYLLWTKEWKVRFQQEKVRKLYKAAIFSNAFHYLIDGPISYGLVRAYVDSRGSYSALYAVPGVLLTQALGYACGHAWMHRPKNYWIHKYHHQFNETTFVRPVTANSVTQTEFLLAYALPIVVGVAIFRPTAQVMYYLTCVISMANLAIHTPPSIFPMSDWMPSWLVTNTKHFYHHEKDVLRYFSAPIFDMDELVGLTKKRS